MHGGQPRSKASNEEKGSCAHNRAKMQHHFTQIRSGTGSLSSLANKYGVGSTISCIKQNGEKILQFRREKLEMGMSRSTKTVRVGEFEELDKASFIWVKQKRAQGIV